MRTTKQSPMQLWLSSQMQNPVGLQISEEDLAYYGTEGFTDNDQQEIDNRPTLNPPTLQLSEHCLVQLQSNVPENSISSNYGIDLYMNALQIVEEYSL